MIRIIGGIEIDLFKVRNLLFVGNKKELILSKYEYCLKVGDSQFSFVRCIAKVYRNCFRPILRPNHYIILKTYGN